MPEKSVAVDEKNEEIKSAEEQKQPEKKIKRVTSDPRFDNVKYLESQEQKALLGMAAAMGLQGDDLKAFMAEMKDS